MALIKSTKYAPDIYKALDGVLQVYKPPRMHGKELLNELKLRIADQLNEYQPRPISKRLLITGDIDEKKNVIEVSNLADHPLVSGPRYVPWEISMSLTKPILGYRSSGSTAILVGTTTNRYFLSKFNRTSLVNVYHVSGKFGYVTDTFFYDGKITDKATYKHIRSGKLDSVLAKIESTQHERLFDSASVPLTSQEAYELAKTWPSRPPKMAKWPVIFRLRCLHLKLPEFKFELTVSNENETFIAQLTHDIGQMLRSAAYTESIRRVKFGPFDVNDSITDKEWDLQSIINNLAIHNSEMGRAKLHQVLDTHEVAMSIRTKHEPEFLIQKKIDKNAIEHNSNNR